VRRATLVDTMPGGVAGQTAGAATGVRRLATPSEMAAYLQVPVKTLYTWRYQGKGPRTHSVGRYLRYRWEDVEAWLALGRPLDEGLMGGGSGNAWR